MKASIKFSVITIFPEMVESALSYGVIGKAIDKGLIELTTVNPRDFSQDKHNRIDDRPFGGGAGMVMMYDPLVRTVEYLKQQDKNLRLNFLCPHGKKLNQNIINTLAAETHIVLLCGRYEGIDQRFIDKYVDNEISLGDFVISGGELAAAVIIDAVARQIPLVLGDEESAKTDSFMQQLLGPPQYTRSEVLQQSGVPEVLLSGNHANIAKWREQQALKTTQLKRPDLLNKG
ncbi:tRNA (guanine(37)-N(1))-methyltransferase [hydrothermal vent metagenome]|uniref:tRNA (guanine-N(1)-)-methyltransferase n=1 Tax=hydrothermal vent metagenome TaxID=652676 RepID=A0A3B0VS75_9ZZZZ